MFQSYVNLLMGWAKSNFKRGPEVLWTSSFTEKKEAFSLPSCGSTDGKNWPEWPKIKNQRPMLDRGRKKRYREMEII